MGHNFKRIGHQDLVKIHIEHETLHREETSRTPGNLYNKTSKRYTENIHSS